MTETKKSVAAVMNPVRKKAYAVSAYITIEKEESCQHVILLQKWKLPMTEA